MMIALEKGTRSMEEAFKMALELSREEAVEALIYKRQDGAMLVCERAEYRSWFGEIVAMVTHPLHM